MVWYVWATHSRWWPRVNTANDSGLKIPLGGELPPYTSYTLPTSTSIHVLSSIQGRTTPLTPLTLSFHLHLCLILLSEEGYSPLLFFSSSHYPLQHLLLCISLSLLFILAVPSLHFPPVTFSLFFVIILPLHFLS